MNRQRVNWIAVLPFCARDETPADLAEARHAARAGVARGHPYGPHPCRRYRVAQSALPLPFRGRAGDHWLPLIGLHDGRDEYGGVLGPEVNVGVLPAAWADPNDRSNRRRCRDEVSPGADAVTGVSRQCPGKPRGLTPSDRTVVAASPLSVCDPNDGGDHGCE